VAGISRAARWSGYQPEAGSATLHTRTELAPSRGPASSPREPAALVRSIGLSGLVRPASEHAAEARGSAVERMLPVLPPLRQLLPGGGLRRGATVAVGTGCAPGSGSVLLALLSAASTAGSWCAVIGLPDLGAVAAAEAGIALDRFALVPHPGPEWPSVAAALLDGLDIVAVAAPGPVAPSLAARLAARARQRGSVLVPYGGWSGADVTLEPVAGSWYGLGQGRGRLARRELVIASRGRGAAAWPRQATLSLPVTGTDPVPVEPAAPLQLAVAG
jgi:hypothetical protein